MKIGTILIMAITSVLIVVCALSLFMNAGQTAKNTTTTTKPSMNHVGSALPQNKDTETAPSESSSSTGKILAEDSPSIDEVLPNTTSNTLASQNAPVTAQNETATASVSPPDGRIYSGGEAPYAYIPTCSQKERPMPIVPLTPVD